MTEDWRAEADNATEGTEVTLLSATVEDTGAGSWGRAAGRDTTGAEVITEENALDEIAEGAAITLLDAATGDNDGVKLSTDDSVSGAEDTLAAPVEDRTAELSGRALKAELPEATLELAAAATDDTEEATTEEGERTEELAAPGRETLDVNTPAEEPVTLNEDMARTGPTEGKERGSGTL